MWLSHLEILNSYTDPLLMSNAHLHVAQREG